MFYLWRLKIIETMKKLFIWAIAICSALSVSAQSKLPANFFMKTLPNGLQVLVIEDNTVPLATIEIVVKNGSYTEDSAFNGLSHLYEHMFFKANKDIPSQEKFLERVNELGISFNGTTSDERVNYFITLSNAKLQEGLAFMNSAIRYPLFLEEEMKKENPVVDGEFQRAESNPYYFLIEDFGKAMWGKNYYRKNPIGLHDVILTCTPEKMNIIKDKYYYPNNAMIAIAGDVNHDDIFKQVASVFGDWKPCDFDPFAKWPIPEFDPLKGDKKFAMTGANAQVPLLFIGYHGPDTRNDLRATYAADVFNTILGLSDCKLQQELIESGLAYQVQVSYQTQKYTGPIQIVLVPNPMSMKDAYDVLYKNIAQWTSPDYFTDEQMQTAKNQLAIADSYGKESTSQYIHLVTYWWASATIDYYTNYQENLQKVTRDDILYYLNKYVIGKPSVSGLLIPTSMKDMLDVTPMGFTKPE